MDLTQLTKEQREALGLTDERKDFYFKVENVAVDNPKIFDTDREFILFIVLSRYCNDNQVGFPSLETLAEKSRCTKKNMLIALKGLVKKGLIKKVQRFDSVKKNYQSNLYSVQNIKEYVAKNKDLLGSVGSDTRGVVSVATPGGSVGSDTRVVSVATPYKEQDIKNNYNINHDHDNELDFFENLFLEEFKINFTKTNKDSVLKLRKHLSFKNTENYLRETYNNIKENKEVINIAALFSSKIKKGERQINSLKQDPLKEKELEKATKEKEQKELEKVSKEKEQKELEKATKEKEQKELEKVSKEKEQEETQLMNYYHSLDEFDQLKIEEKALELLTKEEQLNLNFIIGIKEKQPIIYNGMIKPYLKRIISSNKGV